MEWWNAHSARVSEARGCNRTQKRALRSEFRRSEFRRSEFRVYAVQGAERVCGNVTARKRDFDRKAA